MYKHVFNNNKNHWLINLSNINNKNMKRKEKKTTEITKHKIKDKSLAEYNILYL